MGGAGFSDCGLLPLPLDKPCQACGQGLLATHVLKNGTRKYALPRALRRIDPQLLFENLTCPRNNYLCSLCLIRNLQGRTCYLLGIGEGFYDTPGKFMREAVTMGISKRIPQIPPDLVVGKDGEKKVSVIFLCHPAALTPTTVSKYGNEDEGEVLSIEKVPGVICLFRPKAIEYVVKGDETDEYIESLVKRGITPVQVIRVSHGIQETSQAEDVPEEASV